MIEFEWDKNKAATNKKKHGVSFSEATTVFGDTLELTIEVQYIYRANIDF